MNVWLVKIGEPLPIYDKKERLLRTGLIAEYLVASGHSVTWWTSTFDHAHKVHHYSSDHTFKVNDNYRIVLLHGTGYSKNISLRRILDYKIISTKLRRMAMCEQAPDIIYCAFPTHDFCRSAALVSQYFRVPLVIDVRDLWPNIFMDMFIPNFLTLLGRFVLWPMTKDMNYAFHRAKAIWGTSPYFVEHGLYYSGRSKNSHDISFPLGYSLKYYPDSEMAEGNKFWQNIGLDPKAEQFVISYVGTLSRTLKNEMHTVIDSAKYFHSIGVRIKFAICGDGDILNDCKIYADNCPNIIFPGWITPQQIAVLMKMSSLAMIPYPNREDLLNSLPNKLFEYLAHGLPILSSNNGLLKNVLETNNCGLVYVSEDYKSLNDVITSLYDNKRLLSDMSHNAHHLYEKEFSSEIIYDNIVKQLELLVAA